ncbi:MAG: copper-binding protein [Candidatus Bathyarchaeia archaeon]
MRRLIFAVLSLAILFGCEKQEVKRPAQPVVVRKFETRGRVEAVDAKTGKITIDHEKIPDYMDAMTMSFTVKETAMLEGLTAGDTISFTIEDAAGVARIVAIRKESN